jgi:AraC-like DNA-binding protein
MSFKYPIKTDPLAAYDSHIYYIIKGAGSIASAGKTEHFSEGSVINIPAGTDYLFSSEDEFSCISINYDYIKSNTRSLEPMTPVELCELRTVQIYERAEFEDHPILNAMAHFPAADALKPLFERIELEFISKKHLYREAASAALKEILTELLRHSLSDSETDKKTERILRYIREHYAEDISNARLSEVFGYHPYHLNRLMKAALGTTLHGYLISYRIEMAKRRLTDTDLAVAEIGRECGYNSFSAFSSDFKKRCGCTPLSYREKSRRR